MGKQVDAASLDDVELLAAVPHDEWAFPEFYRRHFFDLAGWLYRSTEDALAAHHLAVEAMASAFRSAVMPRRRKLKAPREWVFGLALDGLIAWRERGEVGRAESERLELTLPVGEDRLAAIVERSRELPMTDGLSDAEAMAVVVQASARLDRSVDLGVGE